MRFVIINRDDELSKKGTEKIITALTAEGHILDAEQPNLVISVGGDGTLLEAFRLYQEQLDTIHFVGVHSGSLGFYTDWLLIEIDEFIAQVLTEEYETDIFPVLETELVYQDDKCQFLSLNEITISDYHRTLALNVYINDVHLETFRGTGFCVSTPSGSTAYNKSLGGAIINPTMRTYQLTEMASINNNIYRTMGTSLIFSEHEKVRLEFLNENNTIVFTNDHLAFPQDLPKEMYMSIYEKGVKFARFKEQSFWHRVRKAFIE